MDDFNKKLKKVRTGCIIASVIVAILVLGVAIIKVGLVNSFANSGMEYFSEKMGTGDNSAYYGLFGVGTAIIGTIGIMFFWLKGLIVLFITEGLIWLGYLIYYLTNRKKETKENVIIEEEKTK